MKRSAILGVVVALAVSGCGDDDGNGSTAETPNREVVLLTHSSFAASEDVLAAFAAESGFTVKLFPAGDAGATVNEAILRKRNPVADVLFGVDNAFLSRALGADIFVAHEAAGLDQVPDALQVDPQHRVTPIDRGNVCINVDTSWFGRRGRPEAPTSFADLVDRRYKDLLVVENPGTASPGLAFLLATIADQGRDGWQDYWRRLRDNGVRVVEDWTQAYQSDFTAGGGNGDRPIVVSYGSSPPADVVFSEPKRDEPRIGVVASTCFRQVEFAGVLRGARNEAGARALVDFMLSERFQEDMPLQMFVHPVRRGVDLPPEFEKWAVDPKKPLTLPADEISANRDDWIKEWTDIVLR
jgi:thiamine transport system substrate-binding protein